MSYIEKIQQIDSLQAAIQAHGPIAPALLNKINYKLRLEWNYTSNSMEGNTLTKRETRTVMVNVLDVNGKPIKDIMEIHNHDKVISTIMKMGKGELNISESRIKEIHKGIMFEDDPEKVKYIGQWKNVDNFMTNYDDERYDFVPHAEVPQRMHELVNWINSEKEKIERNKKDASHPLALALKFHIDYLTIHPFYDGNGRTARILSNLILISYGFPPLYIKEEEKPNYYRYLTDIQSNGGRPDLFYDFMAGLLLRSMQIVTDTVEGKDVEEEEDFIKEIQLLKAKHNDKGIPKSPKVVYNTFKQVETNLWQSIKDTLSHFNDLFSENKISRKVNGLEEVVKSNGIFEIMAPNQQSGSTIFEVDIYKKDIYKLSWEYKLFALKIADSPIDFIIAFEVVFDNYKYQIDLKATDHTNSRYPYSIFKIEKLYDRYFLPEDISDINAVLKSHLLNEIKKRIENGDNKFDE